MTPDDFESYVGGLRGEHEARKEIASERMRRSTAEEELAKQEELARVYRVSERLLLLERNL